MDFLVGRVCRRGAEVLSGAGRGAAGEDWEVEGSGRARRVTRGVKTQAGRLHHNEGMEDPERIIDLAFPAAGRIRVTADTPGVGRLAAEARRFLTEVGLPAGGGVWG